MSMMMKYLRYVMALLLMVLAIETDAVERKKFNFNYLEDLISKFIIYR